MNTDVQYLLDGLPLTECPTAALLREQSAGHWMDSQEGLSRDRIDRLIAIERELETRTDIPEDDGI